LLSIYLVPFYCPFTLSLLAAISLSLLVAIALPLLAAIAAAITFRTTFALGRSAGAAWAIAGGASAYYFIHYRLTSFFGFFADQQLYYTTICHKNQGKTRYCWLYTATVGCEINF